MLMIENYVDIVWGVDFLDEGEVGFLVKNVYFFIQIVLFMFVVWDELILVIYKDLVKLVFVFYEEIGGYIFEVVNYVLCCDFYKVMCVLCLLIQYEVWFLDMLQGKFDDVQVSVVVEQDRFEWLLVYQD